MTMTTTTDGNLTGSIAVQGGGNHTTMIMYVVDVQHEGTTREKIIIKTKIGGARRWVKRENITAIIGQFDTAKFAELDVAVKAVDAAADAESENDMSDYLPAPITGCMVGDTLILQGGDRVTYRGYKIRRPKNPVQFSKNGRPMKCALGNVQGFEKAVA
jgi:hypothetical protein